jgi:hypothetical protein
MFPRRRVNSVVGPPSLSEALHMHLFNNCRNRDHKQRYGTKALYDLNTTGHQATLANDLQRGDQCIVASVPTRRRVKFDWYRFTRDEVRPLRHRSPLQGFVRGANQIRDIDAAPPR